MLPVASEAHSFDFTAKAQLPNAQVLVVVPDHDLVGGVPRALPSAHKSENVAAKEHLDDADAAAGEV